MKQLYFGHYNGAKKACTKQYSEMAIKKYN